MPTTLQDISHWLLTKGLHIALVDEREGDDRVEFCYEGGIRDFVQYVNGTSATA